MDKDRVFAHASEGDVTRTIIAGFAKEMADYVTCDAIVVGAGPSGLICAREMAREGMRTLLIERNNYLGGGFWIGGFLMNTLTVRTPAERHLEALGVGMRQEKPGLYAASGPEACSKLIASTCDEGVKILNMASVQDVVLRNGRVEGVVVNWTPVEALPRQITCVDPVSFEAKVVVDATGHDAVVASTLAQRGLMTMAGMGAMDVDSSEDAIVEHTQEVFPGLIACGMSVSTIWGLPRMGPTFGGMLLSGLKAAGLAMSADVPVRVEAEAATV